MALHEPHSIADRKLQHLKARVVVIETYDLELTEMR